MRYLILCSVLLLAGCASAANPPTSGQPDSSAAMGTANTEKDILRDQIADCWHVPKTATDPKKLIVKINVEVNRDRIIKSLVILDSARMESDPDFRAMANSARKALQNPDCRPLKLPPDKYDDWKEIKFTFDPSKMAKGK